MNQRHEDQEQDPTISEQIGEGVGGVGGTLTGAAIGALGGPLGAILGGIAGALGGWWAGEKLGQAVDEAVAADEAYRNHYTSRPVEGLSYEEMHPAYVVGHAAAENPDWADRTWEEIEPELHRSWSYPGLTWEQARPYALQAFESQRYLRSAP